MKNILVEHNDGWFGTTETELRINAKGLGVLDKTAEHVFTHGQCHALTLHKLTGWPLKGWSYPGKNNGVPNHVTVFCPDNEMFLDIKGWAEKPRWGCDTVDELDPVEVSNFHSYLKPDFKAAEPFAKAVLKKFAPEKLAA